MFSLSGISASVILQLLFMLNLIASWLGKIVDAHTQSIVNMISGLDRVSNIPSHLEPRDSCESGEMCERAYNHTHKASRHRLQGVIRLRR